MRVTLRWWESVLLALPVALGALFVAGGQVAAGVVLLSLTLLIVASRAEIRERNVAGGYAKTRGYLGFVKVTALVAIYIVIGVFMVVAERDDWNDDTRGSVAIYAMAALAFFLLREFNRLGNEALDWIHGGGMEVRVAGELEQLRGEGWLMTHDLKKDQGGNVDHFLTGERGALVIETKTGRNNAAARQQALRNAMWAKSKFGQRYVTAVLCVGTDPPPQPTQYQYVWVTGVGDLVPFLRSYRGRPYGDAERHRPTA